MKRVFLVDDDEIINHVHTMVINRIDPSAEITLFKSGLQFMQAIENSSSFTFPEIIFLDIRMPEMSGFDVLDELIKSHHTNLANTAIYVLSSTLDERDLSKANSYSIVTKFMSKPLNFEVVSDLLSK
jgi:CheY-like chemotaxis protein